MTNDPKRNLSTHAPFHDLEIERLQRELGAARAEAEVASAKLRGIEQDSFILRTSCLKLDLLRMRVFQLSGSGEVPLELSDLQYKLLLLFIRSYGTALPLSEISRELQLGDPRRADAQVVLLRQVFAAVRGPQILFIRGAGYKYIESPSLTHLPYPESA